jgi:hypothetical protein
MGGQESKYTPLECMLKNFKKGFTDYFDIKFTPQKLQNFCEINWPSFEVGWPSKGSFDPGVIWSVYLVVTEKDACPGQFPYISIW